MFFGPCALARSSSLWIELGRVGLSAVSGIKSGSDSTGCSLKTPVSGRALAQRVAKGPLPVEEALEVSLQIAKGLEAAHPEADMRNVE